MKKVTSLDAFHRSIIEPLEARIAPAGLTAPVPLLANAHQHSIAVGSALLLHAGDLLSTSDTGGAFLMFVQAGQALVFTTDFNHNNVLDPNEITGIAAGNGLQLYSFVDIHGDIVTNLNANGTLTDSDSNSNTGPAATNGRDGRVLLPSTITSITMRSITTADLVDQNGDGAVNDVDVLSRLAPSSYTIFGSILAGGGLGDNLYTPFTTTGTGTGAVNTVSPSAHGLLFDTTGFSIQSTNAVDYFIRTNPEVGSILIGTAASGEHFNFGTSQHNVLPQGELLPFHPGIGAVGGGIYNVRGADSSMQFSVDTLRAGDGGFGAAGGSIVNVLLSGDSVTGYSVLAGNGGTGLTGGAGGSIGNFSDFGSLTSRVVLKAGDGGHGLTGAGGPGGLISIGTATLTADVHITLGSGGDGFSAGGVGASLASATITNIGPSVPVAVDLVSTTRDLDLKNLTPAGLPSGAVTPTIGQVQIVDFNHDDSPDLVFSTNNPDTIEVLYGIPGSPGLFSQDNPFLYLEGPAHARLAVADFNNDGLPDIAAASGDASNAGISIYLNKGDGSFTTRLQSTLPTLGDYGYYRGPTHATSITAGDFNGDGIIDIAVNEIYQAKTPAPKPYDVTVILDGIVDPNLGGKHGTGYFVGDFVRDDVIALNPNVQITAPIVELGPEGTVHLHATAVNGNSANDVLLIGKVGQKFFTEVDNTAAAVAATNPVTNPPYTTEPSQNVFSLGKVDTNRALSTQAANGSITRQVTLPDAQLQELTVVDIDSDGNADVVVLTSQPTDFLVTFKGDGGGGFTVASDNPTLPNGNLVPNDNSGIFLGNNGGAGSNGGLGLTNLQTVSIRTTDSDSDGVYDEVAVLDYRTSTNFSVRAIEVNFKVNVNGVDTAGFDQPFASVDNTVPFITPAAVDNSVVAWDTLTAAVDLVGYGVAVPSSANPNFTLLSFNGNGVSGSYNFLNYGLHIVAGDGGNSVVGPGGTGGFLGGKITTTTTFDPTTKLPTSSFTGAIEITLPDNATGKSEFQGVLDLTGGNGGDGFTNGGAGGNVQGISVHFPATTSVLDSGVILTGGDGGFGLTGSGGAGGALVGNSIQTGTNFNAGNGGNGIVGGRGGSIVGNGNKGFFDSEDIQVAVIGGVGGHGINGAGDGGSILNFNVHYLAAGAAGILDYEGGRGGTAVAGRGGAGGALVGVTPDIVDNNLTGEIFLKAGVGGDGLTGGAGGGIATFINSPQPTVTPTTLSILAGDGGHGITGPGGLGGGISTINVSVAGIGGTISTFPYSRIIAGNGGDSFGGAAAQGGSIDNVTSTSQSSSIVVAAGKGGDGLTVGGAGGSVTNSTLNAAATFINGTHIGKQVLVIAGDGGDVYSAAATNTNLVAQLGGPISTYGKINGHAGNGGGINNLTQPNSEQTRVNLIAGNGGNTVNYGSPSDAIVGVGVGGSITNISIAGTIGNLAPEIAIRAYNDIDNNGKVDESMSQFVKNFFVDSLNPLVNLDDSIGNVGLVAGIAGRVKDGLPASPGINGGVSNLVARSILSMVAGSVDNIAAIQVLSGISLSDPNGVFGGDKPVLGQLDYLNQDGSLNNTGPVLGGALIDGAVVAKSLGGLTGPRVFKR